MVVGEALEDGVAAAVVVTAGIVGPVTGFWRSVPCGPLFKIIATLYLVKFKPSLMQALMLNCSIISRKIIKGVYNPAL